MLLLASRAGGYMDNAIISVDGGRNMVSHNSHRHELIWGRTRERTMGSGCPMRYYIR